ncbi:hypothetical protein DFP72DRAFT_858667 [Ephemerocybe angulata]|uniref:Uncharacterized protein n=1 Tax=Ephemerocybe angulata TaxID=980116 RepID=A0A8H6HD50_9AGAR|nr:hypothetical protein DFP72DRAFT_858667 [Tulosesus angulatus]
MVFRRLGRAMRALFEDEAHPNMSQAPQHTPAVHNHPGMMGPGAYGSSDPRLHPAQAYTTTQSSYLYQTHVNMPQAAYQASQGPYATSSDQPQYYINAPPPPHPSVFQPYPSGPTHPPAPLRTQPHKPRPATDTYQYSETLGLE